MRNCAKVIFLRPGSKDIRVLMQLKHSKMTNSVPDCDNSAAKIPNDDVEVLGLSLFPLRTKTEQVRALSVPNPYHCATDESSLDGDI